MRRAGATCLAAAALALSAPGRTERPREIEIDRDDLDVTEDVIVKPGVYRVLDANGDGVLRVKKDGVTIDFAGATLLGNSESTKADAFEGIGVAVEGRARVTIKNAKIHGFRVGIQALRCPELGVMGCDVGGQRRMRLASTPEREDGADWLWPHENDDGQWAARYGAGLWAKECDGASFVANRARASQNGLLLDRTSRARVHDNDLSFLSGWGLAMWRSSQNEIAHNRFDWCVRGYSHGVYDRGQDSAGILVFEQCSENVFAFNSATHGGDGFFLYAGNETLERTGKGGCNGNLLYGNDFSHAVANGIEATFSDGNVFAHNRLDDCSQHGVWAGFSYNTTIVGNHVEDARGGGISIEHGHDNWIEGNVLARNRAAIELWENETTDVTAKPYGRAHETASARTTIARNVFTANEQAIDLRRSKKIAIASNVFAAERRVLRTRGDCDGLTFDGNVLQAGDPPPEYWIRNESGAELRVGPNAWGAAKLDALVGPRVVAGPALDPSTEPGPIERDVKRPRVGGSLDAMLPATALRGRKWILVDDWGPYDFTAPRLFPAEVHGFAEATITLLGPPATFEVASSSPGVTVEPRSGTAPATLRVRVEGDAPRVVPFELRVKLHGHPDPLVARGTLARASWRVRFFGWKPTGARTPPADWKSVIAAKPLEERTVDRLDFAWGGGAPSPRVPADHFATVAEAQMELPKGRYEIRTVSDDGVRVLVDGKTVQEDWTWHPPKENASTVELAAGKHSIRVEHFEIDGFSQLSFSIRPAPSR